MSIPVLLGAKILSIDIYLIEPNHILGRANKFFLKLCKKIFCYNEKLKNYPLELKDKMIIIEPLVKKNIYQIKTSFQTKAYFTILVVGGSQGASFFDHNLKDILVKFSKKKSIKIYQQTKKKNINFLSDFYSQNYIENKIFNFEKNFDDILKQTDLCITRAGASSLAELSILNVPFIAVPLPSSKDNHQYINASFYKDLDCCWVVDQNKFYEEIEKIFENILSDKAVYLKKKENLKKINFQNTWNNVNQKILKTIYEN